MKKYCIIGGIIGFIAGLSMLGFMPIPFFSQLEYLIFLGFIWDALTSFLGNAIGPDFGEGIGWFFFIFTTITGVLYGYMAYEIKVALSNKKLIARVAIKAVIIIAIIIGGYFWQQKQIESALNEIPEENQSTQNQIYKNQGEKKDETLQWQTYENKKYKYSINYPGNMSVDNPPAEEAQWVSISRNDPAGLLLNIGTGNASFVGKDIKKDCFIDAKYFKTITADENEIALCINDSDSKTESLSVLIPKDKNKLSSNPFDYILIEGQYEKNQVEKYRDLFEKIISTFKFTDSNEVAGWQTYRNEKYGFEFQYPKDLSAEQNTNVDYFSLDIGEKSNDNVALSSNHPFGINFGIKKTTYKNTNDWFSSFKKEFEKPTEYEGIPVHLKISSVVDSTINGLEIKKYVPAGGISPFYNICAGFVKNDYAYEICYAGLKISDYASAKIGVDEYGQNKYDDEKLEEARARYRKLFDDILATIKFTK